MIIRLKVGNRNFLNLIINGHEQQIEQIFSCRQVIIRMKYQKINNIITLSGESVQSLQLNYLPLSVKVLSSREAKTLMSLKKE